MAEAPTTGELFKAKAILEEDLTAAVDAFMADPSLSTFHIGPGYTLNPHDAVSTSPFALSVLSNQ